MYDDLSNVFESVPLPHLPNPCFKAKITSIYVSSYEDIYKNFKDNFNKDEDTLNFTNLAHYTFIKPYPSPRERMIPYRQLFHTLLKPKKKNKIIATYILERALKTLKINKSETVLVGTHVRRTDYLVYTVGEHLRYPSAEFYLNAFNFFRLK